MRGLFIFIAVMVAGVLAGGISGRVVGNAIEPSSDRPSATMSEMLNLWDGGSSTLEGAQPAGTGRAAESLASQSLRLGPRFLHTDVAGEGLAASWSAAQVGGSNPVGGVFGASRQTPSQVSSSNTSRYFQVSRQVSSSIRPRLLGDVNGDGVVSIRDVFLVGSALGRMPSGSLVLDWNGDDLVDVLDLALVSSHLGDRF